MISMSKEAMIGYLRDYANIQSRMAYYPNMKIGSCFDTYLKCCGREEDINDEYYITMFRVYISYVFFRYFSIGEDFLLNKDDFLSENELKDFIHQCTFYEKPAGITNKKIIQLLRNAFNHNDDPNFDKFKISVNGKYFEIEYKDIRTEREILANAPLKPLKFKFDIKYLIELNKLISDKRQSLLFYNFNIQGPIDLQSDVLKKQIEKITLERLYVNKKLPRELVQKSSDSLKKYHASNGEETDGIFDFCEEVAKLNFEEKIFRLTKEQINKVLEIIKYFQTYYPYLNNNESNITILNYVLERVIPIPLFKSKVLLNQFFFSYSILSKENLTLDEAIDKIKKNIISQENPNYDIKFEEIFSNELRNTKKSSKLTFFRDIVSEDFLTKYPIIMYIDAVITHLCQDEKIVIDGIDYSKEKVRNSFVHGRWFLSSNHKIIMYDADAKNINDYNLEYIGEIDIDSFAQWATNYEEEMRKEKGMGTVKVLTKTKNMYEISPMSFDF